MVFWLLQKGPGGMFWGGNNFHIIILLVHLFLQTIFYDKVERLGEIKIFLTQYISRGTCENVCSFQYITSWLWNSSRLNSVKFIGQSWNNKGNFLLTTGRILIEFRHNQKVKHVKTCYVHLKNSVSSEHTDTSKLLNSSSSWKNICD